MTLTLPRSLCLSEYPGVDVVPGGGVAVLRPRAYEVEGEDLGGGVRVPLDRDRIVGEHAGCRRQGVLCCRGVGDTPTSWPPPLIDSPASPSEARCLA